MAISKKASIEVNRTISGLHKFYGAVSPSDGFFISDEKIISHAKRCFGFWDFASKINIVTVEDRQGNSFLSAIGNPASSRTDVSQHDRITSNLLANSSSYSVAQMNTDVSVSYGLLNQWAMSNRSFRVEYVDFTLKRVGIDRLIAGWHGSSVENTTNPGANPLLSNVALGWLHNVASQFPSRILGKSNDLIQVGGTAPTSPDPSNDVYYFSNLDQAVLNCVSMIPAQYRDGLVCIVGSALLEDEMQKVYSSDSYLFEKHKNPDVFNNFGNIPRVECHGFPSNGLVVTSPQNLSIYIKSGTSFRQITNNIQRECVADYQTCELAYVVENPNAFFAFNTSCVLVEGMQGYSQDVRSKVFDSANLHDVTVA